MAPEKQKENEEDISEKDCLTKKHKA